MAEPGTHGAGAHAPTDRGQAALASPSGTSSDGGSVRHAHAARIVQRR
jgi:hypothetical protein